ncbi:hypothetical protein [Halobacillus sp. Marseille-Q1614]|uniref:hypothetical protein n=1 Tax=Halobacillus sp. Marseille-Q1614 TaxID=2709134 RepID=UPI0015714D7B|nr:hypothetical protein [Halobacillus sp. Marseille-Q1614]
MSSSTLTVKNNRLTRELTINRMAIYQQCKVVEAYQGDQKYFIFFHKDQYLTYVRTRKPKTHSFVGKVMKKGLILNNPHPLVKTILSNYPHLEKLSIDNLFKKLKKQYPLQEAALISTYFESFIKKEKIIDYIKELYYIQRRDGKLFSCHQLLQLLKDFSPNHSLIQTFSGDLQIASYETLYKNNDASLIDKDPIYAEKYLTSIRPSKKSFQKLLYLYEKQDRRIDVIALYLKRVIQTKSDEVYQSLLAALDSYDIDLEYLELYEDLYKRGLAADSFLYNLLDLYMENEKVDKALTLIHKHNLTVTPLKQEYLGSLIEQHNFSSHSSDPDHLRDLFLLILDFANERVSQKILHEGVVSLLKNNKPSYVSEWLKTFEHRSFTQPLIQKVNEMCVMIEDPNQQGKLGQLYHYFHQPQKAIDCMSWEMELRNEDPQPVQWLAKLYGEIGNKEEQQAYKQMYIRMMKES